MNPLFVPELFHYILDDIVSSTPGGAATNPEERQTLAALAQTCSAFSNPSLDRLWWHLDSLLPLIRSFADIVDEIRVKTPPSPQERHVINRYSYRIRNLTLGIERLSLHFLEHANPALPNLNVLRWEHQPQGRAFTSDRDMSSLLSLLAPKIVTLEVALARTPADQKLQSFLENFTLLCPNLKSIRFDFLTAHDRGTLITLPPNATQALSRAICGRGDWKRVELSCAVDNVAFSHLGLSSALRVASVIPDPGAMRPDKACFGHADIPFRNVTKLVLTVWDHLDVATHLLCPYEQAFEAFKVTLRNTQTTIMDVYALFTAIVSPPRIQSLQSLVIRRSRRHRHVPIQTNETQGLSSETLRPFVSLVHLHDLNITLNYPIMIDDDEFAGLVCNWPSLQVFRLMGTCEESSKAISLKGLLSLLASCPKLYEIGLSLDARQIPSDDPSAGTDLCRPLVTRLFFQDSPITNPETVSTFLLRHLPSVRRVNGGFPMLQRRRLLQLWVRVNALMRKERRREANLRDSTTSVPKPENPSSVDSPATVWR